MLDVGWTEILVIAIVLIIVVGPKDLPQMLRTFGRMVSKMRGMASDFRQQFDEALREADLDDVRKTIGEAQKLNPLNTIRDAVNPLRQMGDDIKSDLQKATGSVSNTTPTASPAEGVPSAEAQKPVVSEPVAVPLKAEPAAKATRKKTGAATDKAAPRKAVKAEAAVKPVAKKATAARTAKTRKGDA